MPRTADQMPDIMANMAPPRAGNGLLARLSSADMAFIEPLLAPAVLTAGQTLYGADEVLSHIYFPTSGVVRTTARLEDGRSAAASLIGADGAVGVLQALSGARSAVEASVLVAGWAMRLPAGALRDLFRASPTAASVLLAHLHDEARALEQTVACCACHRIEQRLANLFLRASRIAGADTLPITHEMAAAMLGAQRTTVTALAHGLKANRAIAYLRAKVVITDPRKLQAAACGCHLPAAGEEAA